jgi:hypothetical protein
MSGLPFPVWSHDPVKPPCQNHRVLINVGPGKYVCAECNNSYSAVLNPIPAGK